MPAGVFGGLPANEVARAGATSAVPFGEEGLVAAVSVRDLSAFLSETLVANDDQRALVDRLDRPVVPAHMRVLALAGNDVRAGQFGCDALANPAGQAS